MEPESIFYCARVFWSFESKVLTTKMEKDNYKSSLHYLALQTAHSGLSFEEFLLYFSNKDIGKLDLAISETSLRQAFYESLGSFYNHYIISCLGELRMLANRKVSIGMCDANHLSISKILYLLITSIILYLILTLFYRGQRFRGIIC